MKNLLIQPLLLLFIHFTLILEMRHIIIIENPQNTCYSAQNSLPLVLFKIVVSVSERSQLQVYYYWNMFMISYIKRIPICSCLSITCSVLKIRALSTYFEMLTSHDKHGVESMHFIVYPPVIIFHLYALH